MVEVSTFQVHTYTGLKHSSLGIAQTQTQVNSDAVYLQLKAEQPVEAKRCTEKEENRYELWIVQDGMSGALRLYDGRLATKPRRR